MVVVQIMKATGGRRVYMLQSVILREKERERETVREKKGKKKDGSRTSNSSVFAYVT